VLGALLELAGEKAQAVSIAPDEALDESWAEPPAFDGCSRRARPPASRNRSTIVRKNPQTGAVA
jgi:nitrate reductase delta subunit